MVSLLTIKELVPVKFRMEIINIFVPRSTVFKDKLFAFKEFRGIVGLIYTFRLYGFILDGSSWVASIRYYIISTMQA